MPIDPESINGHRCAVSFTDDYGSAIFVCCLKNKSDMVQATEKFLADSAPQVTCTRSDNGLEFTGKNYQSVKFHAYRQDRRKLDSRSDKVVFVGDDKNSPAYLVYFPNSGKVQSERHRQ